MSGRLDRIRAAIKVWDGRPGNGLLPDGDHQALAEVIDEALAVPAAPPEHPLPWRFSGDGLRLGAVTVNDAEDRFIGVMFEHEVAEFLVAVVNGSVDA